MKFASLCLLSYDRPQFLYDCIKTIHETAGHPFELILHDDGSQVENIGGLFEHLLGEGIVSTVIRNAPGHNEGVGVAMKRMFDLASGDPIIKLDQDLVFTKQGWLAETVETLRRNKREWETTFSDPDPGFRPIGALGAFKYSAEPVNHEEMFIADHGYYHEVQDFVGSFIAVPRWVYETQGPFEQRSAAFAEDVAFKKKCQEHNLCMALPPEDFCHNVGFGPGPSTVVYAEDGEVKVAAIKQGPVVFDGQ